MTVYVTVSRRCVSRQLPEGIALIFHVVGSLLAVDLIDRLLLSYITDMDDIVIKTVICGCSLVAAFIIQFWLSIVMDCNTTHYYYYENCMFSV